MNWNGVMPAITTCFDESLEVDHGFMAKHCRWLLDNGCSAIVTLGSLGEGATLSFGEKVQILRNCVNAVHGRAPVLASISALSTSEAVALAKDAADAGCAAVGAFGCGRGRGSSSAALMGTVVAVFCSGRPSGAAPALPAPSLISPRTAPTATVAPSARCYRSST